MRAVPSSYSLVRAHAGQEERGDFIEGIFGRLFGKAALEDSSPFGMKRLTPEECPEMWPAVVDEFASPLAGGELQHSAHDIMYTFISLNSSKYRLTSN